MTDNAKKYSAIGVIVVALGIAGWQMFGGGGNDAPPTTSVPTERAERQTTDAPERDNARAERADRAAGERSTGERAARSDDGRPQDTSRASRSGTRQKKKESITAPAF